MAFLRLFFSSFSSGSCHFMACWLAMQCATQSLTFPRCIPDNAKCRMLKNLRISYAISNLLIIFSMPCLLHAMYQSTAMRVLGNSLKTLWKKSHTRGEGIILLSFLIKSPIIFHAPLFPMVFTIQKRNLVFRATNVNLSVSHGTIVGDSHGAIVCHQQHCNPWESCKQTIYWSQPCQGVTALSSCNPNYKGFQPSGESQFYKNI